MTSSWPRSAGCTGSTPSGFTAPSTTSRPSSSRPPIITNRTPTSRLESNELSLHQTQGVSVRPGPELAEIRQLRKEVADQRRTIDILKAATTYLAVGGRPATAVMVAFVEEHRDRWPVIAMCTAIALPERGYNAAKVRPRSAPTVSDAVHGSFIGSCERSVGCLTPPP